MTNESLDVNAAKIEHVVEQLRKHNIKLTQTQGLDLVGSHNFNQDFLQTQSEDAESVGIENYLKSNLVADRLPSPERQPG